MVNGDGMGGGSIFWLLLLAVTQSGSSAPSHLLVVGSGARGGSLMDNLQVFRRLCLNGFGDSVCRRQYGVGRQLRRNNAVKVPSYTRLDSAVFYDFNEALVRAVQHREHV